MPPIKAWAITHCLIGGISNTASTARGPMFLGLHPRCVLPGIASKAAASHSAAQN
jgi:hypothetical protein